mmetsp:Transcript_82951/g.173686  ORF Transcript_82951/g.173686 Transcript_82951/m.173686 type:complete len:175 (-) Transcript_82951:105-629(-)
MTSPLPMVGQKLAIVSSPLSRTLPSGATDESYAKYFAELTLDVVEEQIFQKRMQEESGPRLVHLRQNAIGQVTIPPHVEQNGVSTARAQTWTNHPKVDRTMFIMDRRLEMQGRGRQDLASQRHVPALRAFDMRKNFGSKSGPRPFQDSFRAGILNSSKKVPGHPASDAMDLLPH